MPRDVPGILMAAEEDRSPELGAVLGKHIRTRFVDGQPGKDWISAFKNQQSHPVMIMWPYQAQRGYRELQNCLGCSETLLTGESWFHISTPCGLNLGPS